MFTYQHIGLALTVLTVAGLTGLWWWRRRA
jgi:hypothetical protein